MLTPRSFLYTNPRPKHSSRSQQVTSKTQAQKSILREDTPFRPQILPSSPTASIQPLSLEPKYEQCKADVTVTVTPLSVSSSSTESLEMLSRKMGIRRDKREASSPPPPTSRGAITAVVQPITHTTPVQIPKHGNHERTAAQGRRAAYRRKKAMDMHTPESLSPSLAALLAVTDIPRQRSGRRRTRNDGGLTVEEVVEKQQDSESDIGWSMGRGTIDMLLSPPEESFDDDASMSDSNVGSVLSVRTISMDSIPSLGESSMTDYNSFSDTLSGSLPMRRRASSLRRSYLEPIRSPPNSIDDHPLSDDGANDAVEEELQAPQPEPVPEAVARPQYLQPFKPLKAVFKSNLTASLRALRSAAKSFSSLNFPAVPADDLLARSMLTIDASVPFTDERRPPVTEEPPSAELRRYLNPSPSRIPEPRADGRKPGSYSASIQMQTYKIQRSRSAPPASRPSQSATCTTPSILTPGMRQREMRENSDFIRVAVMEMAMRKKGKLDDQRPGRARWALPPRKASMKPYQVGPDGVPARWIPASC